MVMRPEDIEQIQKAVASMQEAWRKTAEQNQPLVEQMLAAQERQREQMAPLVRELQRMEEANRQAVAPFLRAFSSVASALSAGPVVGPPSRAWEVKASEAVEKVKGAAGGAEPAKAELELALTQGITEATERLVQSNTSGSAVLSAAIDRLVASSDSSGKMMGRLTHAYVMLTGVIALATIVSAAVTINAAMPGHGRPILLAGAFFVALTAWVIWRPKGRS